MRDKYRPHEGRRGYKGARERYHGKFRGKGTRQRLEHRREEKPTPINGMCTPVCPLFYCTQKALYIVGKRGSPQAKAYCRLTGSECIGAECQYAACRINSLLPNGKCAKALEKKGARSDEELFREMESIEDYELDEFTRF